MKKRFNISSFGCFLAGMAIVLVMGAAVGPVDEWGRTIKNKLVCAAYYSADTTFSFYAMDHAIKAQGFYSATTGAGVYIGDLSSPAFVQNGYLYNAVHVGTLTLVTTGTQNYLSSSYSTVVCDTSGGDITINGIALSGGKTGQVLKLVKTSDSNNLILSHNNTAGGTKIYTPAAMDTTLSKVQAVDLFYTGSTWIASGFYAE